MSFDKTEKVKIFAFITGGVFFLIGSSLPSGMIGIITLICGVICVVFGFTYSDK